MAQFVAAAVIGLVFGAAYAMLALGVVLVYKGGRVFNFAQGEFGTVAAFGVWVGAVAWGVPYGFAVLLGLAAAVGMGLAVERLVVRPLADAPKVTVLVATAAVALGAIGLELAIGDAAFRFLPAAVPGVAFSVLGTPVTGNQVLMVATLAVLVALLWAFFNRTQLGLAVLAASQEPTATQLVGISTARISALVWGMAGLLGATAGILFAGGNPGGFTPGFVTSQLLVFGFAAAVIGGMDSLPGAVVGGLLVGLARSFTTEYLSSVAAIGDNVRGLEWVVVFFVLLAVLAVRPAGLLGRRV